MALLGRVAVLIPWLGGEIDAGPVMGKRNVERLI